MIHYWYLKGNAIKNTKCLITRPDIAFYDGNTNRINLRYIIHAGMLFDLELGMSGQNPQNLSISPNIVYHQQGEFHQLNAGMQVNLYPFVGGLWMRHNFGNPDVVILLLGFQQENYKIGYSFDYTVSKLGIQTGGAHEVSVAWLFSDRLKINRFHGTRAPAF